MRTVRLHEHLIGSACLTTLAELAPAVAVAAAGGDRAAAARAHFCVTEPMRDLAAVLAAFAAVQRAFGTPARIERLAREAVAAAAADGCVLLELRYSPVFFRKVHPALTHDAIHAAVVRGVAGARAAHPHIAVGLLCVFDRFQDEAEREETLAFVLRHRADFVGVDLANDEALSAEPFVSVFERARAAGLGVTIHCGEIDDDEAPERVRFAVERLGATRIGHGLHVLKDDAAVALCRERGVHFEVNLTSNYLTAACPSVSAHPLPTMLEKLASCSLSTDDPGLFGGITMSGEIELARTELGLSDEQLGAMQRHALAASFVSDETKARVAELLDE